MYWPSYSKALTAIVLDAVTQSWQNAIICKALRNVYVTVDQAFFFIHSAMYIDKTRFVISCFPHHLLHKAMFYYFNNPC